MQFKKYKYPIITFIGVTSILALFMNAAFKQASVEKRTAPNRPGVVQSRSNNFLHIVTKPTFFRTACTEVEIYLSSNSSDHSVGSAAHLEFDLKISLENDSDDIGIYEQDNCLDDPSFNEVTFTIPGSTEGSGYNNADLIKKIYISSTTSAVNTLLASNESQFADITDAADFEFTVINLALGSSVLPVYSMYYLVVPQNSEENCIDLNLNFLAGGIPAYLPNTPDVSTTNELLDLQYNQNSIIHINQYEPFNSESNQSATTSIPLQVCLPESNINSESLYDDPIDLTIQTTIDLSSIYDWVDTEITFESNIVVQVIFAQPAVAVELYSENQFMTDSSCKEMTLKFKDDEGEYAALSSSENFQLTSQNGALKYFSDSNCQDTITGMSLTLNTTEFNFYTKNDFIPFSGTDSVIVSRLIPGSEQQAYTESQLDAWSDDFEFSIRSPWKIFASDSEYTGTFLAGLNRSQLNELCQAQETSGLDTFVALISLNNEDSLQILDYPDFTEQYGVSTQSGMLINNNPIYELEDGFITGAMPGLEGLSLREALGYETGELEYWTFSKQYGDHDDGEDCQDVSSGKYGTGESGLSQLWSDGSAVCGSSKRILCAGFRQTYGVTTDFNSDGALTFQDILHFQTHLINNDPVYNDNGELLGDLDKDGDVDEDDLEILTNLI